MSMNAKVTKIYEYRQTINMVFLGAYVMLIYDHSMFYTNSLIVLSLISCSIDVRRRGKERMYINIVYRLSKMIEGSKNLARTIEHT